MTRSTGNRFVLVLTMALAVGSWLAAGHLESPGEASDREAKSSAALETDEDGWLWSATGENAREYVWAESGDSAEPSVRLAADPSWDGSLRLEATGGDES